MNRHPPQALIMGVAWATMAQALDGRMLAVTLPLVRGHLAATSDEGDWVAIAYLMANIAVLPLSPWLSAWLGRRRYYLLSLAGFAAAAFFCAFSTSIVELVWWRAVQGAFGAGLIAVSQAILRQALPEQKLGLSQVIFAGTFVGAPLALGPLIGGFLVDNDDSWRWTFLIVGMLALVSAFLCSRSLPEQETASRRELDWIGASLLAGALVPLQFVLYEGERYSWWSEPRIGLLVALSVAATAGFLAWELRTPNPLIDRSLFAVPVVAAGVLLIVPVATVLSAVVAIVLQFAEQSLHFTATLAGELTAVRALVFVPLVFLLGITMDRRPMPVRLLLFVGLGLLALSNVMQSFATTTAASFGTVIVSFAVGGIAIAPAVVPLLWSVLRAVPRSQTLGITTMLGLGLQLGGEATPAIVQSVLAHRFAFHYQVLRSSATPSRLAFAHLPAHLHTVQILVRLITEQSYTLAFADVTLVVATIAMLSAILVPFFRPYAPELKRS
ncbi:MFS transporter [bacterium]|nr:MAG: MFS transporter [bacterium]